MSLFSGHDLVCVRSERVVFHNLDFALDGGDALILIGPNGSGKSSLLRLMAGLLAPAAGHLKWDGKPVADEPEEHRGRLHYVGHHDAIKPVLTVEENLGFWAGLRASGKQAREQVRAALEVFDVGHLAEVPGRFLSAGQKRRVNLARILACKAPVWLLDEPTTALDRASIANLECAMAAHRADGGIIVVSTHQDVALAEPKVMDLARFAVRHDPAVTEELVL